MSKQNKKQKGHFQKTMMGKARLIKKGSRQNKRHDKKKQSLKIKPRDKMKNSQQNKKAAKNQIGLWKNKKHMAKQISYGQRKIAPQNRKAVAKEKTNEILVYEQANVMN